MSDETNGRDGPRRVRIGDAERERVLNALQEHLAAGRLTVDEYEERTGQVVAARYADDLAEVLTDLPPTEEEHQREQQRRRSEWPRWQGRLPYPVPLMIGLAVLAIVALPGPPFLLFPLFWFVLALLFLRHARHGWGGRGHHWDDDGRHAGPRRCHGHHQTHGQVV